MKLKALLPPCNRGIVSVGFFATRSGVAAAYPQTPLVDWGVFYGGVGVQLGVQLLGVVVLGLTTLVLNGIGFGALRWLGCLRVSKQAEEEGLDHGQSIGSGTVLYLPCFEHA